MHDMYIPNNKLSEWINESDAIKNAVLRCYKETISDMTNDVLNDPRSRHNHHFVNPDFNQNPKYMMGFFPDMENNQFILSSLYVFPEERGKGFGKKLVNAAQSFVTDKGYIQVAVEESEINNLDTFYKKLGFITTGDKIPNDIGKIYQDYFWSGKEIALKRVGNLIGVQPL
jgi:GNAT superfamily N-acetyltransferase